jgi:hypothetical protein
MSEWDSLPAARQQEIREWNRRHHGSVVGEIAAREVDAQEAARAAIVVFLVAGGFDAAAAAVATATFERPPAPEAGMP